MNSNTHTHSNDPVGGSAAPLALDPDGIIDESAITHAALLAELLEGDDDETLVGLLEAEADETLVEHLRAEADETFIEQLGKLDARRIEQLEADAASSLDNVIEELENVNARLFRIGSLLEAQTSAIREQTTAIENSSDPLYIIGRHLDRMIEDGRKATGQPNKGVNW